MSLDETMTGLMNAARVKFPVCNKLRIKDLTSILLSKNVLFTMPKFFGATTDGNAQRYDLSELHKRGEAFQIYPEDQQANSINVKKGQRIMQSLYLRTDGTFEKAFVSFYKKGIGHCNIEPKVIKIDEHTVKISADYVSDADYSILLLDINQLFIDGGTYFEVFNPSVAVTQIGGELTAPYQRLSGFLLLG